MNWPLFILVNLLFIPTLGQAIFQSKNLPDAATPAGFFLILLLLDLRSLEMWWAWRKGAKRLDGVENDDELC